MEKNKEETTQGLESNERQETLEEQKNHNKFNSVTQKKTPENQNQEHNVRKEGIGKMNQLR